MRSPAIDVVTSCSTDGSVWPSLRMSRRVQRSHGEFVFVGKGATDFRAASRFKSGELRAINMSSNKIQRMLGLAQHSALVSLDLSHNNIQAIEGIEGLASLQVLRLHHNHLTSASGLEPLEQLHVLDLNNNDLTSIAELRYCAALTELDVSCNALAEVDDISSLGRLSTLSVRGNLLKLLDRLPYCLPPSLQTLDLAHNSIGEVSEIQNLASLHNLESVDLSENVFVATASQHGFSYRPLAAAIIPALQTLDGEAVTKAERSTAEQLFNGSGRRNRLLLEVGQEAALLTFLAERCPASVDSSPDHGSSHRRAAAVGHAAPLLGRARAPPTAEQFAELEQQVKEMRRYFKQYVKTEARKRDRATRVLQACVLGHVVRKEFGGRLLSRGRSTGRNDDGRQIELPPPRYDSGADAWRGGASGPGSNGRRAASQQGFDADRYQLVHPAASPRRGLDHLRGDSDRHARHVHVGRRGSDAGEEHRAAQLIQARQRGLIARRRLADFQDCKHSAVRIQAAFRGMAERKRLGMTGRPVYGRERWGQRPGISGSGGNTGGSKAIGFAGLADVAAELGALQRWRSAQEEAMRYLWEEVRQLREWKAARMEADSYLQSSPDASANRELSQMRVELAQLKSRLAQSERGDSIPAPLATTAAAGDGDLASHILQTYRLGGDAEDPAG